MTIRHALWEIFSKPKDVRAASAAYTRTPYKRQASPRFFLYLFALSLFLSRLFPSLERSWISWHPEEAGNSGRKEERKNGQVRGWDWARNSCPTRPKYSLYSCKWEEERTREEERERGMVPYGRTIRNVFREKLFPRETTRLCCGVWLQNPSSPRTRESFFFSFFQNRDFSIHESSRNLARRRQNFPFRSACLWNDHDRRWNSSFHLILSWSIELDKGTGEQAKWSVVNHCTLAWHELWVRAQARPTKFLSSNFWASNFFASFFFREMWNDRKEFNSCEKNSTREF